MLLLAGAIRAGLSSRSPQKTQVSGELDRGCSDPGAGYRLCSPGTCHFLPYVLLSRDQRLLTLSADLYDEAVRIVKQPAVCSFAHLYSPTVQLGSEPGAHILVGIPVSKGVCNVIDSLFRAGPAAGIAKEESAVAEHRVWISL